MFPLHHSSTTPATSHIAQRLPTLMIVGDPSQLNIAREALVELELGWEVVFAEAAFDILDIPAMREVDAVLIDLGSPHLDGVEVVEELHQRYPHLPIVLMTAPYGVNVALDATRKGACNHFPRDLLDTEPTAVLEVLRAVVRDHQQHRHTIQQLDALHFQFTLTNDRSVIGGIVQRLKEAALEVGVCDLPAATRLGIALEEALINAVVHGNLEVSSDLRQHDESLYEALIQERSAQEPYAQRRVLIRADLKSDEATFTIDDEGPGFNIHSVPDPTTEENHTRVGGRGILLMRAFTNAVHFNDRGNQVTLIKRRG